MSKVYEKFDLTGKTALITGGAGLLGVEHATALLESGATIVLTDINQTALSEAREKLLNSADLNQVMTYVMDVSQPEKIKAVAKEIQTKGLRIDILVNNAAIDPKLKQGGEMLESSRLENFPIDQWDLQIAVGLTGAFLCSQVFGTNMTLDRKGGVILNIASDLSVLAPDQRLYRKENLSESMQPVKPITYSVIKTGLIGLTRYLATYWSNYGVRSNALSPGGVSNGQSEEFIQRLNSLIPLGRMAAKNEYRSAIQFLCSDASAYLNGQNIIIDGGRSVL
ncbi:SDR family oxidoreductase [Nitrospinae bacterium]|nr:SDR family oxidoreductase [Nitrospinota bacterium]